MAANPNPIFSKAGAIGGIASTTLLTATGDYTGIGANNILIFTAGATDGGFVQRVRLKAIGTNTATVARFYINNGSTNGTATNNVFYGEVSLPSITANNAAATVDVDYPMNFALPAGYRLYAGLGTTVASGWVASVIAGTY
jgi:hypothetical protein